MFVSYRDYIVCQFTQTVKSIGILIETWQAMRNAHDVYTFAVYRIFVAIGDIRRHSWPDKRIPVYPNTHGSISRLMPGPYCFSRSPRDHSANCVYRQCFASSALFSEQWTLIAQKAIYIYMYTSKGIFACILYTSEKTLLLLVNYPRVTRRIINEQSYQ